MKDSVLSSTDENFAVSLTDNCKTHGDWLSVVRFGLKTLLDNQLLLVEIISREAQRQLEKSPDSHCIADEIRGIFNELGLQIVVTAS